MSVHVCVNRPLLSPINIVATLLYHQDTKTSPTVVILQQTPLRLPAAFEVEIGGSCDTDRALEIPN